MIRKKECTYPNCEDCSIGLTIPECILEDAGIKASEDTYAIPYDGFVLIINEKDEED